jgi:hypothetical protein
MLEPIEKGYAEERAPTKNQIYNDKFLQSSLALQEFVF